MGCLADIWKPWSNWSGCIGGCMGGGIRKRQKLCKDERACKDRSLKDEQECTFDMCGQEWLTAQSTTTTTTTTSTMSTTSSTKQYKIKTPEPTTTTTPAEPTTIKSTTKSSTATTTTTTTTTKRTTTTTTTTKTTTITTTATEAGNENGAAMYCGNMEINDYFTFDKNIKVDKCIGNYCLFRCEDNVPILVNGQPKMKKTGNKISCKKPKKGGFEWRPRLEKGIVKSHLTCEEKNEEATNPEVDAISAGSCGAVTDILNIDRSQVNINCNQRECTFTCVDQTSNPSRGSIVCKGKSYRIKGKESKVVTCSSDPPCGSLLPGNNFHYDKDKISVEYKKLERKSKIHGHAVFNCIKSEEKVIELKRKTVTHISSRLSRKSIHVHHLSQYDEAGYFVACKGSKWQSGKKGKTEILLKCE